MEINNDWEVYYDDTYQCNYYHNSATGETQWEEPSPFDKAEYSDMDSSDEADHKFQYQQEFDEIEHRDLLTCDSPRHSSAIVGGRNQDYLHLASSYVLQRPYMDTAAQLTCILCYEKNASVVFFPCEHRCVCKSCIRLEEICDEGEFKNKDCGHCNCPLCGAIIKKIILHRNGSEAEQYWQWCYEVKPEIPIKFLENFRHSESVIKAVYMNEHDDSNNQDTGCCIA